MENTEIIQDIFYRTKEIVGPVVIGMENPQASHILYYLSLTAGYLKGENEAKVFEKEWNEIKDKVEQGADRQDWLNQSNMINSHLEQALREESVHNPNDSRNIGIAKFYQDNFQRLYEDAKKEYKNFKEDPARELREHYEEINRSQESWEEALRRGDPAAFCD